MWISFHERIAMKYFLTLLLLTINSVSANSAVLNCEVINDHEVISSSQVEPSTGKSLQYASLGSYSFFVKQTESSQFELEIYNSNGPIRSYASGRLEKTSDKLAWTIWTRDILLETNCKLAEEL